MKPLLKTDKDKLQFIDWIAALESGAFEQSYGKLESAEGQCCLGVACLITTKNLGIDEDGFLIGSFPNSQSFTPVWLKNIQNHFDNELGNVYGLSYLNDGLKLNFKQIAYKLREAYDDEIPGLLGDAYETTT